ncbi:xanthine dehydrogenase family protein molybdopterin-binding subunit [Cupriavidus plantarum]|uniref:xanthine dehydrogenase family protein molybdopterin-binding subunit n=1 Tax=Cupriavidus plantarum TaxID=942865 RepID=UPI000EB3DBEA|nr:xanthine dehydrogenase family protein molybdopterin-binding subunit [Cupriavidus plantarum]RLK45700.1 carbon-monoxide dehydrogenase large subunit [Cupriavidus plantarum]
MTESVPRSIVTRLDGDRFVSGSVAYSADLIPAGALHLAIVRSVHANATIVSIDMTAALGMPGVVAGLTGAEAAALCDAMPAAMALPAAAARGPLQSRCLAVGQAVYYGQPVAAVVANSVHAAQAAAGKVAVEYAVHAPTISASAALRDDASIVQPGWETNLLMRDRIRAGNADDAFARAAYVVEGTMTIAPSTSAPIEPLCYVGEWDRRTRRYVLTGTFQNPHTSRWLVAAALRVKESQVRVVAPAIGGTFGLKMAGHPEEVLVALFSKLTGRPVAWTEERRETLLAGARSQHHTFALAADAHGKLIGWRDDILVDVGIIAAGHSWAMALVTPAVFPTVYAIEHCDVACALAITNHAPWQAIRGYGKEIGNLVIERAIDLMARRTGIDPVELRRRNLVPKEALPRLLPSGLNVDSGNYPAALAQLRQLFGYDAWRARARDTQTDVVRIGIGVAFELTPEGGARPGNFPNGYETSTVRLTPSGDIQVLTGVTSPGSGSDTGIAQMVAGELGLRVDQVTVTQGDTDVTPVGTGNASSRALMYGGTAALLAARDLRDKLAMCAANMLGGSAADIKLRDGLAWRGDTGQSVAIADIALGVHVRPFTVAADLVLPLEVTRSFTPANVRVEPDAQGRIATYPTFSYSAHAVAIEVDTELGNARVLDYAVVHDCGVMINPMLVEGQIRGAVAMGIGTALWEELKYDGEHRMITDRFKSYLLPRATDLPPIRVGHLTTPNPFHPLGMKGAGESGVGGALAAAFNAVADALGDDARLEHVPASPARVIAALNGRPA